MKIIIISLAIILAVFSYSNAQNPKVEWKTVVEGFEIGRANGKLIFIDIYTDWCGWCKRMDQTTFIDSKIVNKLNSDFVAVKFNAEGNDTITYGPQTFVNPRPRVSRSTHSFTNVLLGERPGYPSFAILDANLTLIGLLRGFQTVEQLESVLDYFLSNEYVNKTYEEWLKTAK